MKDSPDEVGLASPLTQTVVVSPSWPVEVCSPGYSPSGWSDPVVLMRPAWPAIDKRW